jgi:hypothetical protein
MPSSGASNPIELRHTDTLIYLDIDYIVDHAHGEMERVKKE